MGGTEVTELAELGRKMRKAQKAFFADSGSNVELAEAKRLEKEFDRVCDDVLSGQKELF